MNKDLSSLLHTVFPHLCVACERILLPPENNLCLHCEWAFNDFKKADQPYLNGCFAGKCDIELITAAFQFMKSGALQRSIHQWKYGGKRHTKKDFARLIVMHLERNTIKIPAQAIAFPPSSSKVRSYNQAKELAEELGKYFHLPVIELFKHRKAKTSQTQSGVLERHSNLKDTIVVKRRKIPVNIRQIILVDDVITTGATLSTCGNLLRDLNIRTHIVALAFRKI